MPRVGDEWSSANDRARRRFLEQLEEPFRAQEPDRVFESGALLVEAAAADTPMVAGAALRALEVLAVADLARARERAAGRADAADVERERARFGSYRREVPA